MLKFKVDGRQVTALAKAIDKGFKKQVPYATALALNETAKIAKSNLESAVRRTFVAPTPFVMRSFFILYARSGTYRNGGSQRLSVTVGHKNQGGKNVTVGDYLRPHIEGGHRRMKRSERLFGHYWEPGRDMRLDAYGNVRGSDMVRIISGLKLSGEQGFSANRTARSEKRLKGARKLRKYFIVKMGEKSNRRPGVYEELGNGKVLQLLCFIATPTYKRVYDLNGIVERAFETQYGKQFTVAMDYALATAKIKA